MIKIKVPPQKVVFNMLGWGPGVCHLKEVPGVLEHGLWMTARPGIRASRTLEKPSINGFLTCEKGKF